MNPSRQIQPPSAALWLLKRLFLYRVQYDLLEDMEEAFNDTLSRQSHQQANRWFWRQTLKSSLLYFNNSLKGSAMMLQSVLKTAMRSIKRQRHYMAINLIGLSIGLASALLIFLFVGNEFRYDRHHEKAERIYRLALDANLSGEAIRDTKTPSLLAFTLLETYHEVEQAARIRRGDDVFVRRGDVQYREERLFFADSTLFNIFSLPLSAGDPRYVFALPNSIVLTPQSAQKYFGDADPMGETLQLQNGEDFIVTGVTAALPQTSHFPFDFLANFASHPLNQQDSWISNDVISYFLLREGASIEALEAKLPDFERKHIGGLIEQFMGTTYDDFLASGSRFGFFIQRLLDIHLHSDLTGELGNNGDISNVLVLTAIALVILLVASINFINLATAQSIERANEVGIRKVLGSLRGPLIRQFLMESVVQCLAAFLLAIVLTAVALPHFEHIIDRPIPLDILATWYFIPAVVLGVLFIGLAAGIYPAFVLASFRPIAVLKGKVHRGLKGKNFRSALVIFQFTASVALLICALVIQQQIRYARNKPLGFDKSQVLVIQNSTAAGGQAHALKEALMQAPCVSTASFSNGLPLLGLTGNIYRKRSSEDTHNYTLIRLAVDYDFLETYRLTLDSGRPFDRTRLTDSTAVLLNQTAAQLLKWEEPLSRQLINAGDPERPLDVIGVLKDFHLRPLQAGMFPLVIAISQIQSGRYLSIRLKPNESAGAVDEISRIWRQFVPGQPLDYLFFDDRFDHLYRTEIHMGRVITSFTALALFVACLGLFGLASLTTRMRTKEIGIRKVMGASVPRIMGLLTREIVIWVGIANLAAWPLAWWAMSRWLNGFAYRIDLSLWVFLGSGAAAMGIAVLTVMQLTFRAAQRRPVKTLRYE